MELLSYCQTSLQSEQITSLNAAYLADYLPYLLNSPLVISNPFLHFMAALCNALSSPSEAVGIWELSLPPGDAELIRLLPTTPTVGGGTGCWRSLFFRKPIPSPAQVPIPVQSSAGVALPRAGEPGLAGGCFVCSPLCPLTGSLGNPCKNALGLEKPENVFVSHTWLGFF